jgi:hypothetical protein
MAAADVRLILKKTEAQLSDAQALPFITMAGGVADAVFSEDDELGSTLLAEIKTWLSAHFIAITIMRMSSEEKLGDASVKYIGKYGTKLESTPYGQAVLMMDITGKMANTGKMRASIYAVKGFNE